MYLGCRFAWRTEEAVAAAAEFCDVVSFNIYDRRVDPGKWAFLETLGRPAIIGEFHVGALDRGMFHPGLVSASNQQERAAVYADYVASVLDNPALVGCHWFQYVDEPLTGRVVRRRELQHRLPHGDRHPLPRAGRGSPGHSPPSLCTTIREIGVGTRSLQE